MKDLTSLMLSVLEDDDVIDSCLRAPFGYPGGKRRSLPFILPHLPYRKTYCEVFGGSGSVLLARRKCQLDVYNDRYGGVFCFYKCLHDPVLFDQLAERLSLVPASREEFIWCRDSWVNCTGEVERAARWYISQQLSFGSKGKSFGRQTSGKFTQAARIYNALPDFPALHERLKDCLIENLDWRKCIRDFDSPDTVFYLDPPYYAVANVYQSIFKKEEHEELLNIIFSCDGFVALSGYDNSLYNSFPWDDCFSWTVEVSLKGRIFTASNNHENMDEDDRQAKYAEEKLWVKF